MSRDFNQNRIANAVLKEKKVNSVGNFHAFQDNADGYNVLNVESLPSVKLMTGTNDDITEFAFFNDQNNYGGIGAYSLSALPKLKTIYIYQNSGGEPTIDIDEHAFETNVELEKIYVHPDMKAKYMTAYGSQIAYGTTTIGDLLDEYSLVDEFVIPAMLSGDTAPTTLTNEWLVRAINEVLGNNQVWKNVITKIVVPSYFTGVGVGAFNLSNLNMNYVTELKCNGTKTFNAGFLNGASWCIHLWLDNGSSTFSGAYVNDGTTVLNANFRTLAPYLVFANYFMSEYPSEYPVVGYNQFSSGDDLPRTSPTGEYLWFSNINFDADYDSPTGLENDPSYVDDYKASSSGYYYCYDKIEILIIQGSGTLTSSLVQASINGLDTPLSWIKKVIISAEFTAYDSNCLNGIDTLTNCDTLEIRSAYLPQLSSVYSKYNDSSSKLEEIIFTSSTFTNVPRVFDSCSIIKRIKFTGTTTPSRGIFSNNALTLESFEAPNATEFNCSVASNFINGAVVELPNAVTSKEIYLADNTFARNGPSKIKFYKLQNVNNAYAFGFGGNNNKIFFYGNENVSVEQSNAFTACNSIFYVNANNLNFYINNTVWQTVLTSKVIGMLTYNGTLPTFTGYTPTFYEDEDCTIAITQADMVVDTQYYVKLA